MTRRHALIVGAGPVGLFLALLLAARGRPVAVLERRSGPHPHGRSIGVHPPVLEALAEVGLADELVGRGAPIRRARVILEGRALRTVELAAAPPPFPFVLSLPQGELERLLAARLSELAPFALERGREVVRASVTAGEPEVELAGGEKVRPGVVLACDGRRSAVRASLGIGVTGGAFRHHYLMADLQDERGPGDCAEFYLGSRGVVESFPLPCSRRRWVARVPSRPGDATVQELAREVRARTGVSLPAAPEAAASAFTAESRTARLFALPGLALVGDAAHVVSPIGGQGMNLGMLGARLLADELDRGGDWWSRYARRQARRARRANRRARFNMALGSDRFPPGLRRFLLQLLLERRLEPAVARFFTMRGL